MDYRAYLLLASVNPYKGLFYFDSSFRPVPLEQHFLGVRGKPGSMTSKKNMDFAVFQKVTELVEQGHQVMVFVHARKETVKTALQLKEMIVAEDGLEKFSCEDHPQFQLFRRELSASRNKEMKLLFDNGFGIHHAGMLRSDRNLMEKMFQERAIKVLCCTATLAWGVNLPAHAGAFIYSAEMQPLPNPPCSHHQRHAGVRHWQRGVHGLICPRRFANLWSRRSSWAGDER